MFIPKLSEANSLSLIAIKAIPLLDLSIKYTETNIKTVSPSIIQYINDSLIALLEAIDLTIDTGKLEPDPPPRDCICAKDKRKTSATTQVPMAK